MEEYPFNIPYFYLIHDNKRATFPAALLFFLLWLILVSLASLRRQVVAANIHGVIIVVAIITLFAITIILKIFTF